MDDRQWEQFFDLMEKIINDSGTHSEKAADFLERARHYDADLKKFATYFDDLLPERYAIIVVTRDSTGFYIDDSEPLSNNATDAAIYSTPEDAKSDVYFIKRQWEEEQCIVVKLN